MNVSQFMLLIVESSTTSFILLIENVERNSIYYSNPPFEQNFDFLLSNIKLGHDFAYMFKGHLHL
jgi:hypothetical protein